MDYIPPKKVNKVFCVIDPSDQKGYQHTFNQTKWLDTRYQYEAAFACLTEITHYKTVTYGNKLTITTPILLPRNVKNYFLTYKPEWYTKVIFKTDKHLKKINKPFPWSK